MAKSKKKKTVTKRMVIKKKVKASSSVAKESKEPRARGKKYLEKKASLDRNKLYPIKEALPLVKQVSYSKFDGAVELHLTLKKAGISAPVTLPYSTGKAKKVEVADANTIKKLTAGKVDFDILLATAEMMPKLVPFAKILGPKGLMPNPKNGTIIKDAKEASKFSGNAVTIKSEKKAPLLHTVLGKVSQPESELESNFEAITKAVGKPQIVKVFVKPTMGPSIKVALA